MDVYKAEYIWIDGTKPTAKLRSKTKTVKMGEEPPLWGFDGSSTNQAPGERSDCVLRPVFTCPDPIRKGDNRLVMTEVLLTDYTPHPTNTRAECAEATEKYADQEIAFGIEQEYTFFRGNRPLGFPEAGSAAPQGGYYCGVGADEVFGRDCVEAHLDACLEAELGIFGINAEVMPGQWEFQVGTLGPLDVSDHLWVARWLLYRVAEDFGINATLYPKPARGDWNGAGAHTNFSTKTMRSSYQACIDAAEALGRNHDLHIAHYGDGIEERLTGQHEDLLLQGVPVWCFGPWCFRPHSLASGGGGQGLYRGPAPLCQHRSIRCYPSNHGYCLRRCLSYPWRLTSKVEPGSERDTNMRLLDRSRSL